MTYDSRQSIIGTISVRSKVAQTINRTTKRQNTKGGVKILPALAPSVLLLLTCVLSAGCQTSNAVRQAPWNGGVTSERLTYRQYQLPQPRPSDPSDPSYQPQKASLVDLLNPFKSRTNRTDKASSSATHPQNLRPPAQNPPTPQIPAGFAGNMPSQTSLLREDDPPEIVEFAAVLGETGPFSVEQKAEMLELLRRESPAMRGSMIANFMVAIRHSDFQAGTQLEGPASTPIVQASHVSSIHGGDFNEPSIRLANHIENELATLESLALGHALDTTGNAQGMIRLAADEGTRNASTFRIIRPRGEPGSIPEIDTNPMLPTVAAPDDYAAWRSRESLKPVSDAKPSDSMRDDREIPRFSLSHLSAEPDGKSREIPSNQQADLRLDHRNSGPMGTRIAIVDANLRRSQTIPSPPDAEVEDDGYDITNVAQELGDTVNLRLADADPARLAVQMYPGNLDAAVSLDLQEAPHLRRMTPPFQEERWDEAARRALNLLNARIADSDTLERKEQRHDEIHQRLMSLTLGNQRDAVRTIDGLSPELQEFWRNTMLGLSTMLDDMSFPDSSYRFDAAHRHLQTANSYLQNLCPVRIRKVSFINQCDGFGVYEAAPNEFQRGEPIFIYAEIDNLTCRKNEDGYLTQVNSSYEIIDVFGNKIANGEFSKTGKHTQSRIRDIFLLWRVDLPENIMPGKYFINLSVVDTNHQDYPFNRQRLELNILPSLHNFNNR